MMSPDEYLAKSPVFDPADGSPRQRWEHQKTAFRLSAEQTAFFYSMEQRTGKTQPCIDRMGYLYETGKIDAVLVPSMPSGAPRNWMDELAINLPGRVPRQIMLWKAQKIKNKLVQKELEALLGLQGLSIILINGEAVITKAFLDYIGQFVRKRKVFMVDDESTLLQKTPGSQRTKVLEAIGKHAKYRACLDGTPTGEGPLDLYSQYKFLDPNILGFTSFYSFRARYAVLEKGYNRAANREFVMVKRDEDTGEPIYQNIDELQQRIKPYTFRVRFKEVFKDVPDPVYQKRYFELADEQRRIYDELERELEAYLSAPDGEKVTVANVLTRYLRLQQIACGYWPASKVGAVCPDCRGEGCERCDGLGMVEDTIPLRRLVPFNDNPRVRALADEFQFSSGPAIVWARFNQDIDDVVELCKQLGRRPCQYDGRVSEELKYAGKQGFQSGVYDTFVAKTTSAGRAVNVSAAEWMCYYSSQFGLNQRLQSEVRAQTGTRTIATGIVDLIATNTKDEVIVSSHRGKRRLSDVILNEKSGAWI